MNNNKRYIFLAIIDGITRGALLFLLVEFIGSTYIDAFANWVVLTVIFAGLSAIVFWLLIAHPGSKPIIVFFSGSALYLLACFLIFFNYLSIGIHILPMRELSNGDGILLLFVGGSYEVLSFVARLAVWIGVRIYRARKNLH